MVPWRLRQAAKRSIAPSWWEQRWREGEVGGLSRKIGTIVRELESVVPTIVKHREEAERQAEIERRRWEAECREHALTRLQEWKVPKER
jgi:hypothetical protein